MNAFLDSGERVIGFAKPREDAGSASRGSTRTSSGLTAGLHCDHPWGGAGAGRTGWSAERRGSPERTVTLLRVLSPAVENLVTQLAKLPGIGRRTAQRLAFHLLSARAEDAVELARAIRRSGPRPILPRVREPHRGGTAPCARTCGATARSSAWSSSRSTSGRSNAPTSTTGSTTSSVARYRPLDGVEPSDLRVAGSRSDRAGQGGARSFSPPTRR